MASFDRRQRLSAYYLDYNIRQSYTPSNSNPSRRHGNQLDRLSQFLRLSTTTSGSVQTCCSGVAAIFVLLVASTIVVFVIQRSHPTRRRHSSASWKVNFEQNASNDPTSQLNSQTSDHLLPSARKSRHSRSANKRHRNSFSSLLSSTFWSRKASDTIGGGNHRRIRRRITTGNSTAVASVAAVMASKPSSTPLFRTLTGRYPGAFAVNVVGNFSERLRAFNQVVDLVRSQLIAEITADDQFSTTSTVHSTNTSFNLTAIVTSNDVSAIDVGQKLRWSNKQLLIDVDEDSVNQGLAGQDYIENEASVVVVNEDDYLDVLTEEFPLVKVVILPWLNHPSLSRKRQQQNANAAWDSRVDFSNLLIQNYYAWTVRHPLCAWIGRSFDVVNMRYGLLFQHECLSVDSRIKNAFEVTSASGASIPVWEVFSQTKSLSTLHLRAKTVARTRYWPNDGRSYPKEFYNEPPPIALQIHVLRDAIISTHGDVIGRGRLVNSSKSNAGSRDAFQNVKLARYFCKEPADQSVLKVRDDTTPIYDEVLTAGFYGARNYYHRLIEELPRIAPYVDLLKRHHSIRIHVSDVLPEEVQLTAGLLEALGVPRASDRIVTGQLRAVVAYVPRFAECLWSRPVELQTMSFKFRDYIKSVLYNDDDNVRSDKVNGDDEQVKRGVRDRVVLIRRSGSRRLQQGEVVEKVVRQAASHYGYRYTLFDDQPSPSLKETMRIFNEAVLVIGPHGAGFANIVFSEPGTYVFEFVCQTPITRLCYLHTSHVLGHRYHSMPAVGCPRITYVHFMQVDRVLRVLLERLKTDDVQ